MRSIWKFMRYLPQSLRYKIIRKQFSFDESLPEGITFKAAESTDELEQAFQIIHDGYVERHLIKQNEERLRLTKWNCLPSTTTLICKDGEEVIGTVSLIADSAFGLPTEQYRNLEQFRQNGMRLLEVSGLAIKKNKRSRRGKLILPLCKFMHEYASKVLKGDALIISTVPGIRDFYGALFLFEPMENGNIVKFQSVNNAEAISQILDLRTAREAYRRTFSGKERERDLHYYFFEHSHPEFQFPQQRFQLALSPSFSIDQFRHFFIERSDILNTMSQKERFLLSEYYHFPEYQELISEEGSSWASRRSSPRIPVRYRASVNTGDSVYRVGEVHQIALHGLNLRLASMSLKVGEKVWVSISLAGHERVDVEGSIVWTSGLNAGMKLDHLPNLWKEINQYAWGVLKKELRQSA